MDENKSDNQSLDTISGQELFDLILESSISPNSKREMSAWMRTRGWLDRDQYQLAVSRIEHLKQQL
jgi:hypothetical protein